MPKVQVSITRAPHKVCKKKTICRKVEAAGRCSTSNIPCDDRGVRLLAKHLKGAPLNDEAPAWWISAAGGAGLLASA